jgi:hypothetical protein
MAGDRGGGHLAPPRAGLACIPRRPFEPRPTQGHVGDRALPNGGAGRSCRTLRGLRPPAHLLQLLPQPALSEVPGRCCQGGARRPPGRTAARAPLSRGVTLPAPIADIAYQNTTVICGIPFKAAAETPITSPPTPSTSGPASGSPRRCTAGAQRSPTTRTSTSLYRAAASRWMGNGGSRAAPASSCPYACCRGCFDACSWRSWWPPTTPAACSSSAVTPYSPGAGPSRPIWRPCVEPNGVVCSKRPPELLSKGGGPEAVLAYLSR